MHMLMTSSSSQNGAHLEESHVHVDDLIVEPLPAVQAGNVAPGHVNVSMRHQNLSALALVMPQSIRIPPQILGGQAQPFPPCRMPF